MTRTHRISAVVILLGLAQLAHAQGGIGNMPRQDLVMLSAVTRDSLADEVYNRILDLKRYAETKRPDSAAMIIAYNGASDKSSKWVRAVNAKNDTEMVRVNALLDKLQKTFAASTEIHKEYFAVFKDKDNPAGEKLLYQINFASGKKKHMVSFTFYPIGELLMLGDIQ
jgi:hypothetical protein